MSAERAAESADRDWPDGHRFSRLSALLQRPFVFQVRRAAACGKALIFALPGYSATLMGRSPGVMRNLPPDPWPGDAEHGRAILEGRFVFVGRAVSVLPQADESVARPGLDDLASPTSSGSGSARSNIVWQPTGTDSEWRAALHGFAWLKDLRVVGGEAPRQRARDLVGNWMAQHSRWSRLPWRPDVLANRICAWLGAADFLLAGADNAFAIQFHDSLTRQARHLARALPGDLTGSRLLAAIKGLVYAACCLQDGETRFARAAALLERELGRQVLGDGGHIERSPRHQLSVLRDLIDMRAAIVAARLEIPPALQIGIDRMAPMLRFFRHGDGGLALFNDSVESESWLIDLVLAQADAKGKPLASAPHSGFERVTANRTLLLVDIGAPPPPGYETHAFAGTLAFEMSHGKERLIVNDGANANGTLAWQRAMQSTAAHSTVTIGDTNSTEIFNVPGSVATPPDRLIGRRPDRVTCRRDEADGATWIEGGHDGYLKPYGLIHRRRLYLSAGGDDLRGEDSLLPLDGTQAIKPAAVGKPFAIRFHLHPAVKASLVQDGGAVLLRLAGGGWRFRAAGCDAPTLEESVYHGARGEPRRCAQIVVSGTLPPEGVTIKWALRRVSDR